MRASETQHHQHLIEIASQSPWLMAALSTVRQLGLPHWCIGAGAIRNLVWDSLHGKSSPSQLPDVDIAYFDASDISPQQAASKRVREMLKGGVLEIAPGKDRRELRVALSSLGCTIVARTRAIRETLALELIADAKAEDLQVTRHVLLTAIRRLQMNQAVEQRKIQEHD